MVERNRPFSISVRRDRAEIAPDGDSLSAASASVRSWGALRVMSATLIGQDARDGAAPVGGLVDMKVRAAIARNAPGP